MADMNTPDLIKEVARRMGCYQRDARELLEHFADVVAQQTTSSKRVYISFLGTFYTVPARKPRADGTRRQVLKFKPSRALARRVDQQSG